MSTLALIARAVVAGLEALNTLSPSLALVFTGGRPVEQVSKDVDAHLATLEQREAKGGDDTAGEWDEDLAKRVERAKP